VLRHLLDLIAAEGGSKLVGRNRQVRAAAEPRLHLIAEATLLQLGDQALHVTEVRLRDDESGFELRVHCSSVCCSCRFTCARTP
jgi:hypothetical protein